MSYCRWSSDNFQSDLYCYESTSRGFITHVAELRRAGTPPDVKTPFTPNVTAEELVEAEKRMRAWLDTAELVHIGLPHDGQIFTDETLREFLSRLLYLRKVGYRFPDRVLENVREEIFDEMASAGDEAGAEERRLTVRVICLDIDKLTRLIAECPEERAIEKISLNARLEKVKAELSECDKQLCSEETPVLPAYSGDEL